MGVVYIAAALFVFQNNFWVNLHQALLAQPQGTYTALARRNAVFDRELIAINNRLARVTGDDLPSDLPAGVREALVAAAPSFRATRWPAVTAANERWIASIEPMVRAHGDRLASALASAYHVSWPDAPVLVDVAGDAGPVGAYTTDGPDGTAAHATIAASGANSGEMALEMLFHEASHAVDEAIMKAVRSTAAELRVDEPRNLWHAIIFYTTGELVRRELGKEDDPQYRPYAYRYGVWAKGMARERAALEKFWQPYLDGKATFDEALTEAIRNLAAVQTP